jgi:electron transfer flavoprotein alpha subunit
MSDGPPAIVLAPSTAWGREVAARVAARHGWGLTGDAVDLGIDAGSLVAWKPAFGGSTVAAIHCTSPTQMATVRPGTFAPPRPASDRCADVVTIAAPAPGRVRSSDVTHDDDLDLLADADAVIGIGRGVAPDEYAALEPLRVALGAELAATRKVTDAGDMPRARQIGITGRSVAPRLYVSIGANGKFNHSVGFRNARAVLAINPDPSAVIFDVADAGIVAPWRDAVELLVDALRATGHTD